MTADVGPRTFTDPGPDGCRDYGDRMTTPPVDPRSAWDLPAPGTLPTVAALDELCTRVLAPNPSPMTLDGTNTYVLCRRGEGSAVVVDPGPEDAGHLAAVEQVLAELGASVDAIVVTHHHHDHAAAARAWSRRFATRVVASSPEVAGSDGRVVRDGDRVTAGGLQLEVVATPGHTADHVSVRTPTGGLLTGDHVLGRGTSVVAHPDGDLVAYLESLRRVTRLGPDVLYPGHGPALTEDPGAVLAYYAEHRAFRRAQVLDHLRAGPATPAEIVRTLYAGVDTRLWPAAEASTRATLHLLVAEGRAVWAGEAAPARLVT